MSAFFPEFLIFNPADGLSILEHSAMLDHKIGFKIEEIEGELLRQAKSVLPSGNHKIWGHSIHQGQQTWVGLDHQILQTPYAEFVDICHFLKPFKGSLMVDLGAGYGRLGVVLSYLYPEVNFLGFEFVAERVLEGNRIFSLLHCSQAVLCREDLSQESFLLPEAEYYFIYDLGNISVLRKILRQLAEMAERKRFKVVARGKGIRSLIQYEHPWLSEIFEAFHFENYSIYSMSESLEDS
jgi:hypothetical protein